MLAAQSAGTLAGRLASARGQAAVLSVYTVTLFLSALLLFSVQPVFAKMVLPQLGGSPSVWAVSTCFFQGVLLAGYCYAHLLNRFCPPRFAPLLHLGVLALAYVAMPVGLPENLSEPPSDGAYLWLIGVLAAGVGLPFFAVSANAPLLQAWFSRTGNRHAADPYFLYGASNLGSLIALLAYPVVVEPVFGLSQQSAIWSAGFIALAAAILMSGGLMLVLGGDKAAAREDVPGSAAAEIAPRLADRLRWVLFAAVPSGLLVAFTTHVSTDIAAAPFLWVVPLALFLLTFVLVFRATPLVPNALMVRIQPLLIAITLLTLTGTMFDWWQSSLVAFASFMVTTLVAHRALYENRPSARHLTAFYLWMSFGGMLGGLFAAIVAPQIFNSTYEFPLLLTLGMVCRPGVFAALEGGERRQLARAGVAAMGVLAFGFAIAHAVSPERAWTFAILALAAGTAGLVAAGDRAKLQILMIAAMSAIVSLLPSNLNRGEPTRSFFGVIRVLEAEGGAVRRFLHGTTSHGAQRVRAADGSSIWPPVPATYYYPGSPMAAAVGIARDVAVKPAPDFRVGIVGLGIGSMACYAKNQEAWRFYEIDAAVVDVARDASRFNFLSACQPNADIVLGDARLTLAKEPQATFDYLQIDAFSSDSVPTHLLTAEAMHLYLDKLSGDGVLAIHVSNRHLDLAPVAAAALLAAPGTKVVVVRSRPEVPSVDTTPSVVVLAAKSQAAFARLAQMPNARVAETATAAAWTDDYSDILSALWRVYGPAR